jgi:hypothetical protein
MFPSVEFRRVANAKDSRNSGCTLVMGHSSLSECRQNLAQKKLALGKVKPNLNPRAQAGPCWIAGANFTETPGEAR